MDYAVESFEACIPEFKALCVLHYEEVEEDQIDLDMDYERYIAMEKQGILLFITARDCVLVGYFLALIMPHLHSRTSLTAFTDFFFLMKDYRRHSAGVGLLRFALARVKDRGVERVYASCKLAHDLDPLMRRLGFKEIERTYSMIFDKEVH